MPTKTYLHPHLLPKLHTELLAAFPALGPTLRMEDASGIRRVKASDAPQPLPPGATTDPDDPTYVLLPAEDPNTLHASWPDDSGVTTGQIDPIVAAHDPTPVPTQVELDDDAFTSQLAAALTRLSDIVTNGGAYTAAQVRDAVVDEARILRGTINAVKHRI